MTRAAVAYRAAFRNGDFQGVVLIGRAKGLNRTVGLP